MTRRRHETDDMAPGQDSFLDVVANLVGILIILIMVVGVRAKEAYLDAAPESDKSPVPTTAEVQQAQAAADAIARDVHEISDKIQRHAVEIAFRRNERDKVLVLLTAAERALEAEKLKLTDEQRAQLQTQSELQTLEQQIVDLQRAREVAENSSSGSSIIQHLPTPMAKTVFGKELHFRLMGGRLTALPWDELVERLKQEAQQNLWRLKDADQITQEAGPVGGFRIRYTLKKVDYPMQTKAGLLVQRRVELDLFQLIPVSEDLGEPVERALQPGSIFQTLLADHNPQQTTLTMWVYPDGFDHFRHLKEAVFKQGYLTAARPMPEGRLIGGSPQGTRSASQ